MSINKVIVSGNVTRDPELRSTSGGSSILTIGIAVNERRKNNQTGEWEDSPNFFDVVFFGNRAESLSRFLRKGSKVCVEGKLHWSSWEKDGQKRSKVDIWGDEIEFMSRDAQQQPAEPHQAQRYQQPAQPVQSISQVAPQYQQAQRAVAQAVPVDQYSDEPIPF